MALLPSRRAEPPQPPTCGSMIVKCLPVSACGPPMKVPQIDAKLPAGGRPAGRGGGPAEEGAEDRREAAGGEPLAEVRREAPPHHVVEPDLDLVVRREGRRRPRVEDRARTGQHLERPEMARVGGRV